MKLQINGQHIAATLVFLVSTFGPQLLPAGSLTHWIGTLGPWGNLLALVIALIASSIFVIPGNPAGGGTVNVTDKAPKPPTYRAMPAMGFFAMSIGLFVCFDCGTKTVPIVSDVGQVSVCVVDAILSQVEAGQTDASSIALAVSSQCGAVTAEEVWTIIEILLAPPPDAAIVLTDAGTLPTIEVARARLTETTKTKLRAVHR